MSDINAEIITWIQVTKVDKCALCKGTGKIRGGHVTCPKCGGKKVAKGDVQGHPFHGNQFTGGAGELLPQGAPAFGNHFSGNEYPPKNWGDRNSTPKALASITAKDYASSWNQKPMTDTAAKIMEAESRHPDMAAALVGRPKMSSYERSADAIPRWLVNQVTEKDLAALTDNNFHASVRYIESQRPDLIQKSVSEITKGDTPGHEFHGNQYTGGNAGAHFDGFRPMDPSQTLAQIGKMNILGISGGRVENLHNSDGEIVGVRLPVSKGYAVNVLLHPNDTYTVQRTFTRSGTTTIKGQEDGVYAHEVGDASYRAGMYVNVPFGAHNSK